MTWVITYFDKIILSMSSLQTTHHNICAAKGVRILILNRMRYLRRKLSQIPNWNLSIKLSGSIYIWLELCVCLLEMHGLPIEHCISLL